MNSYRIAVVVGSLRKESLNRRFAQALEKLAPAGFQFHHVDIGTLPLYDQDDDANPATSVMRLREDLRAADAVLFATPEYSRSISGVLKNALDHGARPHGKSVWAGKPAGIVGVSPGSIGTACAQQHLRTILAALDMPTLGQPEMFIHFKDGLLDADGGIAEASRAFAQKWMDAFVAHVKRNATRA